jgi:putative ABC transport system permease protein
MSFLSAIRVALAALLVNKGRSALTSLGIVIGISAVIAMVAAGSGAKGKLDEQLESVGKTIILVREGGRTNQGIKTHATPLTPDDVKALREDALLQRYVVGVAESQHLLQTLFAQNGRNHPTSISGGEPDIQVVRKWKPRLGRFFDDNDVKKAALVCVLGDSVCTKLFPNQDSPVGERIRVGHLYLEVIGVVHPKGRAPTGVDQDDQIFIPITTLREKLAHEKRVDVIVTAARTTDLIKPAEKRITEILRERHRLLSDQGDDFEVSSVDEMAKLAKIIMKTLTILIVVIASISLIVGGIGIMNIMLVSVTERTREIGIRMAVGATPRDIRNQFLIEAVVLALLGGALGVSLGIGAANALAFFAKWPVEYSPYIVALAFGVSAAVGVFFGYYPAVKASRLDPIEALRYE